MKQLSTNVLVEPRKEILDPIGVLMGNAIVNKSESAYLKVINTTDKVLTLTARKIIAQCQSASIPAGESLKTVSFGRENELEELQNSLSTKIISLTVFTVSHNKFSIHTCLYILIIFI